MCENTPTLKIYLKNLPFIEHKISVFPMFKALTSLSFNLSSRRLRIVELEFVIDISNKLSPSLFLIAAFTFFFSKN